MVLLGGFCKISKNYWGVSAKICKNSYRFLQQNIAKTIAKTIKGKVLDLLQKPLQKLLFIAKTIA